MSLYCFFELYIYKCNSFNYCMLTRPEQHIATQIFQFEHGLSLKLSQKVANFLKPTPL